MSKEYTSQEELINTRFKDAGYIEVQQPHPDYLGAFTIGEVSLKQFYKWLDGKYMIRFGTMSPKINAMEPITYNIIFYNGLKPGVSSSIFKLLKQIISFPLLKNMQKICITN